MNVVQKSCKGCVIDRQFHTRVSPSYSVLKPGQASFISVSRQSQFVSRLSHTKISAGESISYTWKPPTKFSLFLGSQIVAFSPRST